MEVKFIINLIYTKEADLSGVMLGIRRIEIIRIVRFMMKKKILSVCVRVNVSEQYIFMCSFSRSCAPLFREWWLL